MGTRVAAIILAAGEGRRAGGPKAFLILDGKSFLARIAGTLSAAVLETIVAVVRAQDLDAARTCAPSVKFVVNPSPERGMLSSVRIGIDAAGDRDGYLIIPVDHPLIAAATYRRIVLAFESTSGSVVQTRHEGKSGHPVIIPRALARSLPDSDIDGGLAAIVRTSGIPAASVEVDDPGVLKNVNTKEDLPG